LLWVLIVYLISAISWGTVFFQLLRLIFKTPKENRPSLLISLMVASLALFVESMYFGYSSFLALIGDQSGFMVMYQGENWFLVKILIAVSGVLLMFNLKSGKKKGEK
jgi:uncharacterized membrane protein